jgi:3-deoxy-D-manno-octulosonic-acid transferase
LRAYRRFAAAATPLLPLLISRRLGRGKEHPERVSERRGEPGKLRPRGPLVWIHGASVGEMLAIVPIAEHIDSRGFNVLVTSGTVTSAQLAEWRLPSGVLHQFVPYDTPGFVARFLDHWQPDLAIFAESDLWPNLIMGGSERRIPLILINGRLSEKSFRRWKRFPATISALLSRFELCLAQSAADAGRYTELGAPRVTTTGNVKLDAAAPPVDERALRSMTRAVGNRPIIAAASTHPGEEKIAIDVHRHLRDRFPGLLTVIAPRHPERGDGVLDIAHGSDLNAVARSRGHLPDRGTEIYVADTLGELGLIYRMSPIVFVGGSLVRHGGQNPIEAAKLGSAIVHGPHVWNFAEIYAELDRSEGAAEVYDADRLTDRIGTWLQDTAACRAAADAALQTVEALGGAHGRTLAALDPYLMQLRLEQT